MSREVSMNTQDKQINSAVNSCRMALYNNNKAQSTNKTTRLINNLFKKYRKDYAENEDESAKIDTLSIGLQLKEAVDAIFDPTTGMSEEEKKKFVQKLYRKLESGKKLSADEMQYLRKNDPVTYAKAAKVQVLRESLKKQLKSATSKEKAADIYTQAMSRISEDDPARKEIMAAYDDVYKEFRKSDEYKALPNTEKEAKEKEANNKNKNAQGWEEKEDNDTEMPIGNIDVVEKLM
jgi:DNA-directed RNA polymerase subunit H (RpoH/RPB5)